MTYDSNPGFQLFGFEGGVYDAETKLVMVRGEGLRCKYWKVD